MLGGSFSTTRAQSQYRSDAGTARPVDAGARLTRFVAFWGGTPTIHRRGSIGPCSRVMQSPTRVLREADRDTFVRP